MTAGGVWLLRGEDEIIAAQALSQLVHELVGAGDRTLMVDDFDGDEYPLTDVVDAAQTPPFLTDARVVVARQVGRFGSDDLAPLIGYLADPLPTTALVLTAVGGKVPKGLLDAVKKGGGIVRDTDPPTRAKDRQAWIDERLHGAEVRLDASAKSLLADTLGEDLNRLDAVLATLDATFGHTKLTAAEVRPFLGEAGSVPPWELTDAIDRGDVDQAIAKLTRLLRAGERHPLQLLATLHTHYARMLRLDGSGIGSEHDAASLLGIKGSTFPAKKALDQARRLGSTGIQRAIALLADADLDVRGRRDWPESLVLEVLVARLARLAPANVSRRR